MHPLGVRTRRGIIRLKFLQGLSNVQTLNKNTSLATGNVMYELSTNADMVINTAGLKADSNASFQTPKNISEFGKYAFNFENPGGSIDLAYTRKILKKLKVSLAVNNIGFITWNGNVSNF